MAVVGPRRGKIKVMAYTHALGGRGGGVEEYHPTL